MASPLLSERIGLVAMRSLCPKHSGEVMECLYLKKYVFSAVVDHADYISSYPFKTTRNHSKLLRAWLEVETWEG
ncbi:hypothetical protein FRX31_021358, partial [Thalictrum thalictroides]